MKLLFYFQLVGFLCGQVSKETKAAEAITSFTPAWPSEYAGYVWGGAGFAFAPRWDVAVTHLGFADTNLNAVNNEAMNVMVWDVDGRVVGSAIVTSNSPAYNFSRYERVWPFMLRSGQTYYLSGRGASTPMWLGWLIDNGAFTVATDFDYQGAALATNSNGVFPEYVWPATRLIVGPNFQFIPAPFVLMDGLHLNGNHIQVEVTLGGGTSPAVILLEAERPNGPWTTNSTAVLVTNTVGSPYTITATPSPGNRFFRLRSAAQ